MDQANESPSIPLFQRAKRTLVVVLALISAATTHAQTTAFTYQGELNANGSLADGSFDLRFGLFAQLSGGAQIGGDQTASAVPVDDGIFTVQLDFGSSAFPGANRFLEVSVRPAGSGTFTTLAPRQQISSTPYSLRTLSAATADALSNACVNCVKDTQIENVSGSKIMGAIPPSSVPSGSGDYIQNTSTTQANANFNVAGNGTVGGTVSAAAVTVGGATTSTGVTLAVNGLARITPGGSGGLLQLGTPNGESGLSFIGATNRADVRFNDSTLKLVAGPTGGPPGATSGVSVNSVGSVGVGIDGPLTGKLHVVSDGFPAIYAESNNRAVWGRSTGGSRGGYFDSVSGEGVHGESVSGTGVAGVSQGPDGYGVAGINGTGGTGVLGHSSGGFNTGFAMVSDGHAKQTRDKGGWVKAMAVIDEDGAILQCYNSQEPVFRTTGGCGITVTTSPYYVVNFGFNVADRFVSITPIQINILEHPVGYLVPDDSPNAWGVQFHEVTSTAAGSFTLPARFMILVF